MADDAEDDGRRSGDHDGEPQNITTDSTVAARHEKLMIEKIGANWHQGIHPNDNGGSDIVRAAMTFMRNA
ncbi:hypothetical protein ACWEO2_13645 [Nocardia sp. NPDC004278]